ncbi:class I SAM-dependent methyltransferase [Streptomyces sp. NPDC058086]|uniref:class I SAM-dependent methyltransferase n=1 Tax=Streptomyces sp. NPDC058086 TaxID=3346334 RepID=UPI0036E2FD1F
MVPARPGTPCPISPTSCLVTTGIRTEDLCRVLDLASGMGKYAAYLAREHGALADAVDASPTQYERARARYSQQPGLNLVLADAVEYLRHAKPYDLYRCKGRPTVHRSPGARMNAPWASMSRFNCAAETV